MNHRFNALKQWTMHTLNQIDCGIEPLVTEASKRQFYRVRVADQTWVVMDSPPVDEPLGPFLAIAQAMHQGGLNAPKILATEVEQGFVLMSDLGDTMYSQVLNDASMARLYQEAIDALIQLHQLSTATVGYTLPHFDANFIKQELGYFHQWFLSTHLGISLNKDMEAGLVLAYETMIAVAKVQPQVFIHRDFHSRNLIVHPEQPGIVDVQDAVIGPLVYDLVSLLKDCYVKWPTDQIEPLVHYFQMQAENSNLLQPMPLKDFFAWFDWIGMQRHLKVLGIFSRLHHRDGKSHYLNHLPRIVEYVIEASARYPASAPLHEFFVSIIQPAMQKQLVQIQVG
jgi:aminoglycoside/choline kinase family phosphotransferase